MTPTPDGSSDAGRARAWGWVAHLREGGTTPWAEWRTPGDPTARVLPGAQQLELLRRINLASDGPVDPRLVERVLVATAPGRGLPELELVGAALDLRFGTPPVDPRDLPASEILRVATHLLAQDLVALGPVRRARVRQRPLRRRRVLVGDPWLRSELTRQLTERGRAPAAGGRVVVVGAGLPRMLADAWTNACFERPVGPWSEWLAFWGNRDDLPPGLDLPRIVEEWCDSVGPEHVDVVLDERDLPRALACSGLAPVRRPGRTAAEVSRRVAYSLSLLIPISRRRPLLRHGLLPRLPDHLFDTGPPVLPPEAHEWVDARGARLAERLEEAGYPVGEPQRSAAGSATSDAQRSAGVDDETLDLVVRLLLGGWKDGSAT